jgi:acyl-CoA dehydrogenase
VHKSFVANKRAKAYKPVEQGWPSAHIPTRKVELRERFAEFLDHEAANF